MKCFLLALFLVFSCGSPEKETIVQPVPPPPPPGSGGGPVTFSDISGITQTFCASCHSGAGFLQAEDSFRKSAACRKVENRTMPPQNSRNYGDWTDDLRQIVVNFCRE